MCSADGRNFLNTITENYSSFVSYTRWDWTTMRQRREKTEPCLVYVGLNEVIMCVYILLDHFDIIYFRNNVIGILIYSNDFIFTFGY